MDPQVQSALMGMMTGILVFILELQFSALFAIGKYLQKQENRDGPA